MEILLGFLQGLSGWADTLAIGAGVGVVVTLIGRMIMTFASADEPECKSIVRLLAVWRHYNRRFIFAFIPLLLLSLIPGVETLWKVRLGLLKLSLASPENVQAGTEEIRVIAKKLECKYLGGEGCEPPAKAAK